MSNTYFTSDLHIGHARILELGHRPFASLDEMHDQLMTRWNNTVTSEDDIVWVLGDLSIDSQTDLALEVMSQCRGRKRLITGNHDRCWVGKSDYMRTMPKYAQYFEIISPWARAKVDGVKVVLSHFPYSGDHTEGTRYDEYRMKWSETPLVHGHTHAHGDPVSWATQPFPNGTMTKQARQVHVGVDATDYTPVSQQAVHEMLVR